MSDKNPPASGFQYSLANLKTYRFSEAEIQEMKRQVESDEVRESSEVNFLFALAKAYEDRGDFQQAFMHRLPAHE